MNALYPLRILALVMLLFPLCSSGDEPTQEEPALQEVGGKAVSYREIGQVLGNAGFSYSPTGEPTGFTFGVRTESLLRLTGVDRDELLDQTGDWTFLDVDLSVQLEPKGTAEKFLTRYFLKVNGVKIADSTRKASASFLLLEASRDTWESRIVDNFEAAALGFTWAVSGSSVRAMSPRLEKKSYVDLALYATFLAATLRRIEQTKGENAGEDAWKSVMRIFTLGLNPAYVQNVAPEQWLRYALRGEIGVGTTWHFESEKDSPDRIDGIAEFAFEWHFAQEWAISLAAQYRYLFLDDQSDHSVNLGGQVIYTP